jgi:hypothetical protein
MISENPFLLIDSAVADIVGNQPRTTYLILDAHHSIPFQFIGDTGLYEAPARFRARLSHDGVWNRGTRQWTTPPTRYKVSLYDGALHYTFVAIREDVPKNQWSYGTDNFGMCPPGTDCASTLHDRPFLLQQLRAAGVRVEGDPISTWSTWSAGQNPGFGIPYYGLCTLIEDQHGNRVEIEYCDFVQQSMDDPLTECVECSQNCPGKGQIKSIKVVSAEGVLRWTLLYVYRIATMVRRRFLRFRSRSQAPTIDVVVESSTQFMSMRVSIYRWIH